MCLFFFGCPTAVIGLVIAVIVDPVDRKILSVSIRERPIAERSKVMPFLAHSYSAPTITVKMLNIWVTAPVKHPVPDTIQPAGLASMCL